ncbi:hypothetical protein OAT72_02220 [Alphaproteobacteria bacterium]|nr:hypothetical protein [Alphaproteobacteria bacterium]
MSPRKVTHEIKLPLSLTIILGVIAFGLVADVFKPVFNIEEAFASSQVHKIAICREDGKSCAGIRGHSNKAYGGGYFRTVSD